MINAGMGIHYFDDAPVRPTGEQPIVGRGESALFRQLQDEWRLRNHRRID